MRSRFLAFLFWLAYLVMRVVDPPHRLAKAVWRFIAAVYYLPIVAVDRRVAEINYLRVKQQTAITEANLNVARIGEILIRLGKGHNIEAGHACLTSVVKAVVPPQPAVPLRSADDKARMQ